MNNKSYVTLMVFVVMFLLICTCLSGCIHFSSTPFPNEWSENKINNCNAIEGTYINESEQVPGQEVKGYLFELMLLAGQVDRQNEQLTFTFKEGGILNVSGLTEQQNFYAEKGEFRCKDGSVEISKSSGRIEKEGWGPVWSEHFVSLTKSADKSLIVKLKESGGGLLGWFVPTYMRMVRWYKFKPVLPEPVKVYLIPLSDFPLDYANELSSSLTTNLGIYVKSTPLVSTALLPTQNYITSISSIITDDKQYVTDDIVKSLEASISNLPKKESKTVYIILTTKDINDKSMNNRFLFSWHQMDKHISVISTARMGNLKGDLLDNKYVVWRRIFKMTKRAIGEQYYKLPKSSEITDIMYSPIRSLDDLDKIGSEYLELKMKAPTTR